MGYAFADQKWNPVYKAVCEELTAAQKELSGWAERCVAAEFAAGAAREEADTEEEEADEMAEANEKLEAQVEALRMELASAKGNLEGTEEGYSLALISTKEVVEGLRKELTSAKAELIAARGEVEVAEMLRKKLQGEVDSATQLFQAMRSDLERLNAENKEMELAALILSKKLADETVSSKALQQQIVEDKQMVQRHLKEIAKENAEVTAWEKEEIKRLRKDVRAQEARVAWHADMAKRDMEAITKKNAEMTAWEKEEIERLREENKELQKKNAGLLELVNPTIKLMKSNPELFGGEALPSGAASPRPPAIIRMKEEVKEEDKGRALNFLRSMLAPPRPCLLVESTSTVLPGVEEAEPSSQTEGLCMALTKEQYKEMFGPDLPPPIVPDAPKVCGTAGCIECPAVEPVAVAVPEPVAVAAPEPVAVAAPVAKPKPNYNHPNWPSPKTKRFAKHLAKHSGKTDPKTIKTHEDALEYIAKRSNISVETLLQWTMSHYQSFSQPWTLMKGGSQYFDMGAAPATWWC
jgi:hypothetical protein